MGWRKAWIGALVLLLVGLSLLRLGKDRGESQAGAGRAPVGWASGEPAFDDGSSDSGTTTAPGGDRESVSQGPRSEPSVSPPPAVASAGDLALFAGTVVDLSGRAVAEALVFAGHRPGVTTASAADGSFRLVVPGPDPTERLIVTHPHYVTVRHGLEGAQVRGQADLRIVLAGGASLCLEVVDGAGWPVEGARCRLLDEAILAGPRFIGPEDQRRRFERGMLDLGARVRRAESDAQGLACFDGIADGSYTLEVVADGYLTHRAAEGLTLSSDQQPEDRRVQLQEGRWLRGWVEDEAGRPVAQAVVQAVFDNGEYRRTTTDAEGSFRLGSFLLEDGEMRVTADGYASHWQVAEVVEPVRVQLRPPRSLVLRPRNPDGSRWTEGELSIRCVKQETSLSITGLSTRVFLPAQEEVRFGDLDTQVIALELEFEGGHRARVDTAEPWVGPRAVDLEVPETPLRRHRLRVLNPDGGWAQGELAVTLTTSRTDEQGLRLTRTRRLALEPDAQGQYWLAETDVRVEEGEDLWLGVRQQDRIAPAIQIKAVGQAWLPEPWDLALEAGED